MGFRYSIENFRGVAILFVVLSHLMSIHYAGDVGKYLYYLLGDATAWFIFISGYLFAYLEFGKFNFPNYMKKKLQYVLLPYLIISGLAIGMAVAAGVPQLVGLSALGFTAWALLAGGILIPPLWFIPMITLFFLATPALNAMRNHKALYIACALALAVSLFTARPFGNTNPLLAFIHFAGFYLLGVLAAINAQRIDSLSTPWAATLVLVGLAVFVAGAPLYPGHDPGETFSRHSGDLDVMQLGKLALLVAVFIGFEKFFNRRNALLSYVANISFGIFFVHGVFMGTSSTLAMHIDFPNDLSLLATEAVVVLLLSFSTVALLKKLLGSRSRYVIGC
jgi:surface polysaccharide O-acyltransferase-like enzyme